MIFYAKIFICNSRISLRFALFFIRVFFLEWLQSHSIYNYFHEHVLCIQVRQIISTVIPANLYGIWSITTFELCSVDWMNCRKAERDE